MNFSGGFSQDQCFKSNPEARVSWMLDFQTLKPSSLERKKQFALKGSKTVELVCILSLEVIASSQLAQDGVLWVLRCPAADPLKPAFRVSC